ncbi:MAG: N-acetyl-gamma-glutamyl-phosphate reductase [Thermaerobacter sp.]|nr:N-acetyl-gamma-glutamyl-phosphate reductase [Thermaerobacter sp.]
MHEVAVVGATGYAGGELLRILHGHPGLRLVAAASRSAAGQRLDRVWPHLASDLVLEEPVPEALAARARTVFLALPPGLAMEQAPRLLAAGARVVDLGADFRLRAAKEYREWYGREHASPELLAQAVYALPELARPTLPGARLLACPGCYPTAVLLAAAPLLARGLADPDSLVADAKSGVSGAGRAATREVHFCEVDAGVRAYAVAGRHRHIPEMEQQLAIFAGRPVRLSFTPHLVPMSRGILATLYAALTGPSDTERLTGVYRDFYRDAPFVRVRDDLPATKEVAGTNRCDLAPRVDPRTGRAVVVACIDNLGKGAAGQAVQALNLALGLPETAGLSLSGLYP